MTNLSYCRFRNTLIDLRHCAEYACDSLSKEEHAARIQLLALCRQLADIEENDIVQDDDDDDGDDQ